MQLGDSSLSPNAQLRTLNPHVGGALRAHVACGLPTQVTQKWARSMLMGGVSSFGYAGTIAHAVLAVGSGGGGEPLAFGRVKDSPDVLGFGSRGAEAASEALGVTSSLSERRDPHASSEPILEGCSQTDAGFCRAADASEALAFGHRDGQGMVGLAWG